MPDRSQPGDGAPSLARALVTMCAAVVLLAVPVAIVAVALSPVVASSALPGAVVGGIVASRLGLRWGLAASATMAVVAVVLALVGGIPWLGGLAMAAIGALLGLSHRTRLHLAMLLVATFSAVIVVNPGAADTSSPADRVPATEIAFADALALGGAILLAGVLAATVFALVVRNRPSRPWDPLPWTPTIVMAIALAVSLGVSTGLVLAFERRPAAAWLMLTLVVLIQPARGETTRRSVQRVLGTAAGAVAAAALAAAIPEPGVSVALGLGLLVFANALLFSEPGRYWLFTAVMTPGVILLGAPAAEAARAAELRVLFTVIAGVVALAVVLAVRLTVERMVPRSRAPEGPPAAGAA